MNTTLKAVAIGCAVAASFAMIACEEQGGSSSGGGGSGAMGGLAEDPSSLLGRSAATARDATREATAAQDRASRVADGITGQSGRTITAGGLSWTAPSGWTVGTPSSGMRAAELSVDRTTCAFFHFPRGGGSVEANIQRWAGQFTASGGAPAQPKTSRKSINGRTVHLVEVEGAFTDAMTGVTSPQPDWAMRGAIVEGPEGNVMIKWTGPRRAIEDHEREWDAMIAGMGDA